MKDIHNYFFGQIPEMPWRKNKMELKDIFESLSLCINDVPFHRDNKLISARQEEDHLLIFIPGYYIDLNPNGTYSVYGDCEGE